MLEKDVYRRKNSVVGCNVLLTVTEHFQTAIVW